MLLDEVGGSLGVEVTTLFATMRTYIRSYRAGQRVLLEATFLTFITENLLFRKPYAIRFMIFIRLFNPSN
ncbi:hypothetical protein NZ35_17140 [Pseudomonas chlororaphis]|uniref:Uncharacterized protein n=1 Tax=Pseudomonas chlororaphis TaxID=587753 RepID=A0A0A6DBJ2_9PSED|nr:hypothetical protein NZ35_17140 [Pseudomonas chlororaphis]